jgi:hypothetical protein
MIDEIVKTFAEQTIADIKSRIPNVSGSMANSLGYRWNGQELIIFSTQKYFTVLETGRKPGKFAPPQAIQDYVKAKFKISNEKEVRSIAFLINRKLKENGSILYQRGGNSGVISKSINAQNISDNLTKKLVEMVSDYAINEFLK